MAYAWLIAGVLMMLAELLTPGFVVFFFGLAAVTVAGIVAFCRDLPLTWQLASFIVLSIAYLIGLRRWVKSVFSGDGGRPAGMASEFAGRIGRVVEEIRPEVPGRISLGDAEWSAASSQRLAPGAEVRVTGQDNLTLTVEPVA